VQASLAAQLLSQRFPSRPAHAHAGAIADLKGLVVFNNMLMVQTLEHFPLIF
jgi:hypothetical protein